MPERKIGEPNWPTAHCRDKDHRPAAMLVRPPGVYEHTCPACGKIVIFTIQPRVLRGDRIAFRTSTVRRPSRQA